MYVLFVYFLLLFYYETDRTRSTQNKTKKKLDIHSSIHHRFIYSLLDAVPPIHAESSHVATDKVPSM